MQTLHDLLYGWLSITRPDVTWYRGQQNSTPPSTANENFGTYNVISYARQGIDGGFFKYNAGDDKFDQTVFSVKDIVVQVDVYSVDPTAEDILNEVVTQLSSQAQIEAFDKAGYGLLLYTDIRNLSQVHSTNWIKRFSVDLHLSSRLEYKSQIDRIVEFNFKGEIEPNLTLDFTIDDP